MSPQPTTSVVDEIVVQANDLMLKPGLSVGLGDTLAKAPWPRCRSQMR